MDQQAIIADFEKRAAEAGFTIAKLCEEAGLHPTTFSRWKRSERNPNPVGMNFNSMAAIERVLNATPRKRPTPAQMDDAA